ncbi:MAG TPA: sigma-70 family RNA polymerase sigma factor [Terriglobales bacterium]|nr:sigma-70 family RNA polymerase sigma factor [Terriglobales bacterium]
MGEPKPAAKWAADFSALVREHQAMVFSVAYHFLRERAAAEELAQDVFLELYRHLDEMQSAEHVVFWLRRVAANRCISEARRRQRHPEVPLEENWERAAPSAERDPVLAEHLRRLVASLPEKARVAVILRYQEDLSAEEIAGILQEPVNTVKSQLHRALAVLRQKAASLVER